MSDLTTTAQLAEQLRNLTAYVEQDDRIVLDAAADRLEQLERERAWIPITPSSMPREGKQVILLYAASCGRLFDIARLKGNHWKNDHWPADERLSDDIFSHWCELPPPPTLPSTEKP